MGMMVNVWWNTSSHATDYHALASSWGLDRATQFTIDETGWITIIDDQIPVAPDCERVEEARSGKVVYIGGWAPWITSFKVDKSFNLQLLQVIEDPNYPVFWNDLLEISPHEEYLIVSTYGRYIKSLFINEDLITSYTNHLYYDTLLNYICGISKNNTIISLGEYESGSRQLGIKIFSLGLNGEITYTGQFIPVGTGGSTFWGYDLSRDGNTFVLSYLGGPATISSFRIHEEGTVNEVSTLTLVGDNPRDGMITPDSRYYIQVFASMPYAKVYRIHEDSSLTYVNRLEGLETAQTVAITPDGNYVLVVHAPYPSTTKLKVYRFFHDGSSEALHETLYNGYFSDVKFIPPQVLCEYGVVGDEWESFEGWTTGSAAVFFTEPAFDRGTSGTLCIRSLDNTSAFGFWQSPGDAAMVVPYSLYRARYEVRRLGAAPGERLPTLRLRLNAQTFQQSDDLTIASLPTALPSPAGEWSGYDVFFESPLASCSRPEDQDDVFACLDLYSFDTGETIGTGVELGRVFIDRVPIDILTSTSLVRDYTFESGTEGWGAHGAPGYFAPPVATHAPGRLTLTAVNNTNCFGYWSSPVDIPTTTGAQLVRVRFEVSTTVAERTKTPSFRLRLNTGDYAWSANQTIESRLDAEMSPYYEASEPGRRFRYNLYFSKPPTAGAVPLQVSFDLINFTAEDDSTGSLSLHRCAIHTLARPPFPEDAYF